MGQCQRSPQSGWQEACLTAQQIYEYYGSSPLVLSMSGGVDSEAMALPFVHLKIPFQVVIGRYNGGLNAPDYKHAVSFCEFHKISFDFIDIDLDNFYLRQQLHLKYANQVACRSPQLAIHLFLAEQIQGIPLLASNPTNILFPPNMQKPILGLPGEPQSCYARYFHQHDRIAVPYFFHATPELIGAFFRTVQFQNELTHVLRFSTAPPTTYFDKVLKYRQAGFNVVARDFKRTGFEEVKEYFQQLMPSTIDPFNSIFRLEMEKLNPYPLVQLRTVPSIHMPNEHQFRKLLQNMSNFIED